MAALRPLSTATMTVLLALLAAAAAAAASTGDPRDVVTGDRPIWELVRPSDALRAFLEHRAADAPGPLGVVVDTGSAAALQRARAAIADLDRNQNKGPFIFATFHSTGVSEPQLLPSWAELQRAVEAVATAPRPQSEVEGRALGQGPGPLDAVLGVAGVAPRGTRIILVTEDGARGADGETDTVAAVSRALKSNGIELDAWTLGRCDEYEALTNVSRATGGSLGCGDLVERAGAAAAGQVRAEDKAQLVTLAVRRGLEAPTRLQVQVDSSVRALQLQVRGPSGARAALRSPSGGTWTATAAADDGGALSLDRRQLGARAAGPGRWTVEALDGPVDVEVHALSDLGVTAYLEAPEQEGTRHQRADTLAKILLQEPQGVVINAVKLLDISGKEIGSAYQPKENNRTRQLSRRSVTNDQAELTTDKSEWEVEALPSGKPLLVETIGHNTNGEMFTRVSNLTKVDNVVIIPPAVDIELSPNTKLIVRKGENFQISYEVTNNRPNPLLLQFNMKDDLAFLLRLQPIEALIPPGQTIQVVGSLVANQNAADGQTDKVKLTARLAASGQETTKTALVYVQQEQINDVWNPKIWWSWKSTCAGAWDSSNCFTNTWTLELTIQDKDSGLLTISSQPRGVQFRTEFTSGTREEVKAYYSASCCSKRVDITATDLKGNTNRETFDVSSQFLSPAEIASITVGIIGILLIIAVIVLGIMLCRKRESLRLERRLSSRLASRDGR
ncbi:ABC transporter A family member 8 [Frankliniella fusca]|uniref:ABC transporter A family member 8 n=1 Tax=Frankliniella fusca TaxID=407009 RepID=A0AAE1HIK9_9NEOP|nr:ABC transporter A family member 8 [Frankliniella fusca]